LNDSRQPPEINHPNGAIAGRWYSVEGGYFQLPRALRYDDRLTHIQKVVLLTIASHVMLSDEVHPSRQAIRSYTGIDPADITAHTNSLDEFGWLAKSHEEGRTTHYQLQVPLYAIERMRRMNAEVQRLRDAARDARLNARVEREGRAGARY
jgi:DNA-binding MarR family transcriptional regulator